MAVQILFYFLPTTLISPNHQVRVSANCKPKIQGKQQLYIPSLRALVLVHSSSYLTMGMWGAKGAQGEKIKCQPTQPQISDRGRQNTYCAVKYPRFETGQNNLFHRIATHDIHSSQTLSLQVPTAREVQKVSIKNQAFSVLVALSSTRHPS